MSDDREPAAPPDPASLTAEERRLREARAGVPWRAWGPYLSERQWGTVREDYSDSGDAWSYFTHDQARSRAYRWGEDGLAGISDDKQRLCLALALWNERDPILKERLFGLTNAEGNHGEDVKEYYFYVDNLPTHSYQRYALQVPAGRVPLRRPRGGEPGPVPAGVRVRADRHRRLRRRPLLRRRGRVREGRARGHPLPRHRAQPLRRGRRAARAADAVVPQHLVLGRPASPGRGSPASTPPCPASGPSTTSSAYCYLYAEPEADLLFCENETNAARVFGTRARDPLRQGRHRRPSSPRRGHRQPRRRGHQGRGARPAGRARRAARPPRAVRLTRQGPEALTAPFAGADELIARRRAEADEFYDAITPPAVDRRREGGHAPGAGRDAVVQAVLLLRRRPVAARARRPPAAGAQPAGQPQRVLVPHAQPRRGVHARQVGVPLVRRLGPGVPLHSAGHGRPRLRQEPDRPDALPGLPAPERPDARLRVELRRREPAGARLRARSSCRTWRPALGEVDLPFLRAVLLPAAAELHLVGEPQGPARATTCSRAASSAWTTSACSTAAPRCPPAGGWSRPTARPGWRCSARTCSSWPWPCSSTTTSYEEFVLKFVEHFFWIAAAMDPVGEHPDEMWDEEDGFFYDVLRLPDGTGTRLKVRSLVGLLPLCATTRHRAGRPRALPADRRAGRRVPRAQPGPAGQHRRPARARRARPAAAVAGERGQAAAHPGPHAGRGALPGPHGIRSISRWHLEHPYVFDVPAQSTGCSTSRRSRPAGCSAATPTGAGRSGSRSTCC